MIPYFYGGTAVVPPLSLTSAACENDSITTTATKIQTDENRNKNGA
jgi:hypothetical protein